MPGIQPTVTQRVRSFLSRQGAEVRPWAGLDETYAALYGLMRRRRDDAGFWPEVEALLGQLVERALDPAAPQRLPAPDAELLRSWDVEVLVRDLRRALPSGEVPPGYDGVKRFAAGLSSAVLGGFLLLGLAAAGCATDGGSPPDGGSPQGDAATGDGGGDSDAAHGRVCGEDRPAVLAETIDAMDAPETTKDQLCRCVTRLNDSWTSGLAELFATGTAEEIATALSRLSDCCIVDDGTLSTDFEAVETSFLEGTLCDAATPIYKGVFFEG